LIKGVVLHDDPALLTPCTGTQEATQQQETSKTTQQLLESSRRLLRLRHETQQGVTSVRVAGDEHENARRQKEEHVRQVRLAAAANCWLHCTTSPCEAAQQPVVKPRNSLLSSSSSSSSRNQQHSSIEESSSCWCAAVAAVLRVKRALPFSLCVAMHAELFLQAHSVISQHARPERWLAG
jgi:hypothetical protein